MLNENLKAIRKSKGLSQQELGHQAERGASDDFKMGAGIVRSGFGYAAYSIGSS